MQSGLLSGQRQVNFERRAVSRFAVNPDMAAALPDDSIDRRKAQTCALPELLGGEERFEDAGLSLRVHANPCVSNRQEDVGPGQLGRMAAGVVFVQVDV